LFDLAAGKNVGMQTEKAYRSLQKNLAKPKTARMITAKNIL